MTTRRKGVSSKEARHVRLYHWVLQTEAWRDLDPVAHDVYVLIASRYVGPGSNNGRIPYSLLELSQTLHISKQTAMRALQRLQDHGFIVQEMRGSFSRKLRHASEWRLTEFSSDIENRPATKEFAAWKKTKASSLSSPGRVLAWNQAGAVKEQSLNGTHPHGSPATPVVSMRGSPPTPLLVCQGEAPQTGLTESERRRDANQTASASALALHIPPNIQRMN
jgi:hypothetical protein